MKPRHAKSGSLLRSPDSQTQVQRAATIVLNRALALALGFVVIGALVLPRAHKYVGLSLWTLAGATLMVGLVVLYRYLSQRQSLFVHRRHPIQLALLISLATGSVSFVVGRALSYSFGWDARVVLEAAQTLSSTHTLAAYPYDYLSRYPNNIPLFGLDRLLVEFASRTGLEIGEVVALANAISIAVISVSVFAVVAAVSRVEAAHLAQVLVAAVLGISPWLAVPYTDLPAAALVTAALAFGMAYFHRLSGRKSAWAALGAAAVLLGCATVVKPTSLILLIAAPLALLFALPKRQLRRQLTGVGFGIAIAMAIAVVGGSVLPSLSGLDNNKIDPSREFPMNHFARIGMLQKASTDGVVTYGGYDLDAVREMGAAKSVAERKSLSNEAITKRLEELGPYGYAAFLGKKAIWIWSDGTFGSWAEGQDADEPLKRDGPLSTAVQAFLHPTGRFWPAWSAAITGFWTALLAGISFLLWRQSSRREILVLTLTLLGIGAFSLLFEGRARYLLIFLPTTLALFSVLLGGKGGRAGANQSESRLEPSERTDPR